MTCLKKIEAEGGTTLTNRAEMPGMGGVCAYFKDNGIAPASLPVRDRARARRRATRCPDGTPRDPVFASFGLASSALGSLPESSVTVGSSLPE
jgi:hypothetical protein